MANSANTLTSQMISFNYEFKDGAKPNSLTYQGDAHFPKHTNFLRLTKTDDSGKPLPYSVGRVVHVAPILFSEDGAQMSMETIVKFEIKTFDNNPADGLVFFIAPVGTVPSGSSGGTFGVFDSLTGIKPHVFAVEFDTFVNPEVDPNYRHIGIDIECLKSCNTTKVDDAILGQEVTAQINYVEATKMISVVVTTHDSKKYEVSYERDLSTVLKQEVQVGLAASTGANVAIHDVLSWYFKANLVRETAN